MKKDLFILLFFIISLPLFAQNHMELMKMLEGQPNGPGYPYFGYTVAALDFNGDGYDDLVVGSQQWSFDHTLYNTVGKLYFYFGNSNGLPDNPDFTISGYRMLNNVEFYGDHISNLGDLNGDGYEDLGYFTFSDYKWGDNPVNHAKILLGNAIQDSIADYDFAFSGNVYNMENWSEFTYLQPLGDINGDGYDDAGFTVATRTLPIHDETMYYYIVFGNPDNMLPFPQNLEIRLL